jgi:hypothetical protein
MSMRAMRRAAMLIALGVTGTQCGPVYTGAEPSWFLNCTGDQSSCTCPTSPSGSNLTLFPQLLSCTAQTVSGTCCVSADQSSCSCVNIACADDGTTCSCALGSAGVPSGNTVSDCNNSYPTCCITPGIAACTCSSQACGNGTVASTNGCGPGLFACSFLDQDSNLGPGFGTQGTEVCGQGPVTAFQ